MPQLSELFQTVKLPTMPEVAHTLIRTLNDEDAPVDTIRNAISKDPALTVKLVRLANSARFGLPRTVASLEDAILMTGMGQVRTLALSACLNDAFPVIEGLNRDEFWRESMACAGYASWLASHVGIDSQAAWLSGLMLRLGELIIAQHIPGALTEIERQPHLPGGRWQRENHLLGYTESQVTAEMARRWKFPEEIVVGLDAAPDPMAAHRFSRLGGVLHLAELLAETAPHSKDAQSAIDSLPQDVLQALQADKPWLVAHMPDIDTFTDVATLH